MSGRKPILVFSEAGGTGRSYHADLDCPTARKRRIHFLLEPGWRADIAIQGLGRTHRTYQSMPPVFRPVTTNCKGERRFISTIARRLDMLGARSEEHTSELQSLMRISYAVFCLKKKKKEHSKTRQTHHTSTIHNT